MAFTGPNDCERGSGTAARRSDFTSSSPGRAENRGGVWESETGTVSACSANPALRSVVAKDPAQLDTIVYSQISNVLD